MADQNEHGQQQGQPAEQKETPEKKGSRRVIVIGLVALLAIVAIFFYWRSTYSEDTDDAQVDGNLYQVSSRVAGQVINVDVTEQQVVKRGDPIAQIDPRDFEVAVEQAQANLANAQADYESARVNVPITSVTTHTDVLTSGSDVQGNEAAVSQSEAQVLAANQRIEQAKANALKAQLDVDHLTSHARAHLVQIAINLCVVRVL